MSHLHRRALCALFLFVPLTACVATGTYQQKVDEVTALAGKIRTLDEQAQGRQRQIDQLTTEKIDLNRQLGELRQQATDRLEDLNRARGDIARLESVLAARNEETGKALSEMRQAVERLQDENRRLNDQLRQLNEAAVTDKPRQR